MRAKLVSSGNNSEAKIQIDVNSELKVRRRTKMGFEDRARRRIALAVSGCPATCEGKLSQEERKVGAN